MILVGAVVGHFWPAVGVAMQPVAEGFINLIKMLIPPVILCTVVLGISGAGGVKKAGRVGAKALAYFEVVSTFALILGIDKFMSEARAITNHIGNCTAAVIMAIWEGEIDWAKFRAELAAGSRTTI